MKQHLKDVTLVGIDCVDMDRLAFAASVCQHQLRFGQVKLFSSLPHSEQETITINPITSREQYSYFVMKELYKYIETPFALLIQWDGFALNPQAWTDEFRQYDYIGARWAMNDAYNVGNGGFSWRSRQLMEAVALDKQLSRHHPEDYMICRTYGEYLRARGFRFAPATVADRFSVEGALWEGQFGFHRADISRWDRQQLAASHPRYLELFNRYFSDGAKLFHNLSLHTKGLS